MCCTGLVVFESLFLLAEINDATKKIIYNILHIESNYIIFLFEVWCVDGIEYSFGELFNVHVFLVFGGVVSFFHFLKFFFAEFLCCFIPDRS